jgi:hypothetical protein
MASTVPVIKVVTGCIAGLGGGLCQWLILRRVIKCRALHWGATNSLGLGIGLAVGMLIAGTEPPNMNWAFDAPLTDWLGWAVLDTKVFMIAGGILGLAQWLALRQWVRNTGWLVGAGVIGGIAAGALEGTSKDDYILAAGFTSNSLGERLDGGSIVGLPLALVVFGVLLGSALVIILLQANRQVAKTDVSSA